MISFFTVLAWVFGIFCSILFLIRSWTRITYDDRIKMKKSIDPAFKTHLNIPFYFIVSIISWSWIFTH